MYFFWFTHYLKRSQNENTGKKKYWTLRLFQEEAFRSNPVLFLCYISENLTSDSVFIPVFFLLLTYKEILINS